MNTKTSRQSNIELLRIFGAIGVVYLHLNNMSFGGVRPAKDIFGVCQFVLLFLSFKNLNIPNNKLINYIARSAFYVYIVHLHMIRLFNVSLVVTDDTLSQFSFVFSMTIIIFLASFACFAVYDLTFGKLLNIISKRCKKHRYIEQL